MVKSSLPEDALYVLYAVYKCCKKLEELGPGLQMTLSYPTMQCDQTAHALSVSALVLSEHSVGLATSLLCRGVHFHVWTNRENVRVLVQAIRSSSKSVVPICGCFFVLLNCLPKLFQATFSRSCLSNSHCHLTVCYVYARIVLQCSVVLFTCIWSICAPKVRTAVIKSGVLVSLQSGLVLSRFVPLTLQRSSLCICS